MGLYRMRQMGHLVSIRELMGIKGTFKGIKACKGNYKGKGKYKEIKGNYEGIVRKL